MKEWHATNIPQAGKLNEVVEYQLHGIGCFIDFKTHRVDFDFGDKHRYDSFDYKSKF